ncbi:MAG: DUF86 domain-containing protein [Bacteroidetes bacterium]|nr:DUF86 domain-containing protein [Bacteroidota bacterium]
MSEFDIPTLKLMLEMAERIETFTQSIHSSEEFEKDIKTFDACMMDFIVIGELVWKLSDEFQNKHNHIEWYKIRSFRNFAAHQYFGILPLKVWEIIQTKIPELKTNLQKIING